MTSGEYTYVGEHAEIIRILAANARVEVSEYMDQAIGLGICAAQLLLENMAQDVETNLYLGDYGRGEGVPLSFLPTATEITGVDSAVAHLEAELVADMKPINFSIEPRSERIIASLAARIGTTVPVFVDKSIELRFQLGCAQAEGKSLLVDNGPNALALLEIEQ